MRAGRADKLEYVTVTVRRRYTTSLTQENPALIHIPSNTSTLSSGPPTPKTPPPAPKTPPPLKQPTPPRQPPPRQPPSRQPPLHMAVAAALSQDVTNITFKLVGFYGDESDEKEALNHITQLQFACRMRDPVVHDIIIDLFSFTLLGPAQDWWQDQAVWTGKDKVGYTVVVGEWMKR